MQMVVQAESEVICIDSDEEGGGAGSVPAKGDHKSTAGPALNHTGCSNAPKSTSERFQVAFTVKLCSRVGSN